MNLIHNITWINQNMQIAPTIAADHIAREVVSKEVQKILNEEKKQVEEIKEVESIEKILPDEDAKREIQKEALGRDALYEIVIALDENTAKSTYKKTTKPLQKQKPIRQQSADVLYDISSAAEQISKIAEVKTKEK